MTEQRRKTTDGWHRAGMDAEWMACPQSLAKFQCLSPTEIAGRRATHRICALTFPGRCRLAGCAASRLFTAASNRTAGSSGSTRGATRVAVACDGIGASRLSHRFLAAPGPAGSRLRAGVIAERLIERTARCTLERHATPVAADRLPACRCGQARGSRQTPGAARRNIFFAAASKCSCRG